MQSCNENKLVCLTIKPLVEFNSHDEGFFTTEITVKDDNSFTLTSMDIFMKMGDHGHGSAPLIWEEQTVDQGYEYKVQNAFFVMQGTWQIRTFFKLNGKADSIVLPVLIQN